jgi:hypothetical protein
MMGSFEGGRMKKFKATRWLRGSERGGAEDEAGVRRASREVRHREHRYWSRPR